MVGNAVLTPSAIKYIEIAQENGNEILRDTMENISNAVCLISSHYDDFTVDEQTEVQETLVSLAIIRHNLKDLLKP